MPGTRIICTLGPSSDTASVLREMIDAGMSVARLNFSHGSHDGHKKRIDAVHLLNREQPHRVQVLQDLEGFRVRVGTFPGSRDEHMKLTRVTHLTRFTSLRSAVVSMFGFSASVSNDVAESLIAELNKILDDLGLVDSVTIE
jgi:pyruvate kinase